MRFCLKAGDCMDGMLKSIIEMDKQAQEKLKNAEKYRLDAISSLNEKKEAIIREENARAIESAQSKSKINSAHNEKVLADIKKRNEVIVKNMDELFEKNFENWVERIFNETVGE